MKVIRKTQPCNRGRDHSDDVKPAYDLIKHLVAKQHYDIAASYVDKVTDRTMREWSFVKIIQDQFNHTNVINDELLQRMNQKSYPFADVKEHIITALRRQHRQDEIALHPGLTGNIKQ